MNKEYLKKSLCNATICSQETTLMENDASATLKEVRIVDLPPNTLVIKMDKANFDGWIKNNLGWGFNKHCDYALVTDSEVIFVELKSKNELTDNMRNDCEKKFQSDICTIEYADAIFANLLSKNKFFINRKKHYVVFYQALSVSKTPTQTKDKKANNSPETFRPIAIQNQGTIRFEMIL